MKKMDSEYDCFFVQDPITKESYKVESGHLIWRHLGLRFTINGLEAKGLWKVKNKKNV